jgi:hypothetical protein
MKYLCRVVKGQIVVSVGQRVLKFATEHHPEFWDGETLEDQPYIKIEDINVFMDEVVNAINDEREDGSTLLTDMLDAAIKSAVENGCEGIDHDYVPKHPDGCDCERCSPDPTTPTQEKP